MKMLKLSSVFVLTLFFLSAFIPEASARGRCRSSFGLSFNVGAPNYVVAPAPAPVVVAAPAPGYPAYVAPAPYPYYYPNYYAAPAPAPVIVEQRPAVYVQPGFSYHGRWRRY